MKIKERSQELASLLGVTTQETPVSSGAVSAVVDETPEELVPEPIFDFNYNKVKKNYIKKAKESIKKIVRVVINDSTLIDKSFIADKIDQDAEQLAELYYQQKKHEVMQEANMESVRNGNISPRMFETFSILGKNMMDIQKQISEFQIAIKENYAKIKFDSLDGSPMPLMIENNEISSSVQETNVFKNGKEINMSLMEQRKKLLTEAKFEEIKDND